MHGGGAQVLNFSAKGTLSCLIVNADVFLFLVINGVFLEFWF
jgi:hypothetical protein